MKANAITARDFGEGIRASDVTTAVLPIGAVEQHGGHLPFDTDALLAGALAERLAAGLGGYLLPTLAISSSIEHRGAKGTVYLRAETLAAVIGDIAQSLHASGFRRLILANGHGGNWVLKPAIRTVNRADPGFRAVLVTTELRPEFAATVFRHPTGDIHAGEIETSLMLHLFPQQVRRVNQASPASFPDQRMLDYFDATELTPSGYWGWPEFATAEKGALAFEHLVSAALLFVAEVEAQAEKISRR